MADQYDISWLRVLWAGAGLFIVLSIAFVLYAFVGAIVAGLFLYYALRPVNRWLEDHLDHPNVSATVTLLVVGVPLIVVVGYAGLVSIREADAFLRQVNLGQYRSVLQPYIGIASLTEAGNVLNRISAIAPRLVGLGSTIFLWGIRLFVVVTVAFYLLRDDRKISAWFRETMGREYGVVPFLEGVDSDLDVIYTGNLITIGATGAVAVVVYYGLDFLAPANANIVFPILLGLLTGVATLIPAVGMKLVYFPYTGYLVWVAYTTGGGYWFPIVFFLVTLVVVDTVPDIFIRAQISKGDLNMGLMLLTYTLGAVVFGWYGVFLGPILLVLFLHFMRDVFPNLIDSGTKEVVSGND